MVDDDTIVTKATVALSRPSGVPLATAIATSFCGMPIVLQCRNANWTNFRNLGRYRVRSLIVHPHSLCYYPSAFLTKCDINVAPFQLVLRQNAFLKFRFYRWFSKPRGNSLKWLEARNGMRTSNHRQQQSISTIDETVPAWQRKGGGGGEAKFLQKRRAFRTIYSHSAFSRYVEPS